MPVLITAESQLGIEMAKWNVKRPFSPFPRMMYMAQARPDGIMSVGETLDSIFGGQPGSAEAFSTRCQMEVKDEDEMNRRLEQGWRCTPGEAKERLEAKEKAIADTAAHRAYEDRNMSEAARAEVAEAEAATEHHVAEVPEKRRPGRPRKVA
jgi:hypothetical protein